MVYVFLADGFEIIEALAPVDVLRRAKIDTKTVGVTGKTVKSSCGVTVTADITIDEFDFYDVVPTKTIYHSCNDRYSSRQISLCFFLIPCHTTSCVQKQEVEAQWKKNT